MSDSNTLWVVVKPDDPNARVQEMAYFNRADAQKRAEHVNKHDAKYGQARAEVWPVQVWLPPPEPATYARVWPPSFVATTEKGVELDAYEAPVRKFQLSGVYRKLFEPQELTLGQQVSKTWDAWRDQQLALGNFEVASQEPPDNIQGLFEEQSGQMRLFPRDLPQRLHSSPAQPASLAA